MGQSQRRLADAYDVLLDASTRAMVTAKSAEAAVERAHDAMVLAGSAMNAASAAKDKADAAARSAADARLAARQLQRTLAEALDILDPHTGTAS